MEESTYIDFGTALSIVRERWITVTVTVLVAVTAAMGYTLTRTPMYQATAILLAGQDQGIANVDAVTAINQATTTLSRMAADRVVVERALVDISGPKVSAAELSGRVTTRVPANTQTIELMVTDSDPKRAAMYANSIATAFSELVTQNSGKNSTLSATLWQKALVPGSPSSPNMKLNLVLALLLGLFAGVGLAFARNQLDTRWRGERDAEESLGVPVLATIPPIGERASQSRRYA